MEGLSERAVLLRESLNKSQKITDSMVGILDSFNHKFSTLETCMRSTQRPSSIRIAHDNIDNTLKEVEIILAHFELAHKVEAKIQRGPHNDLNSYVEAIEQLRSTIQVFSNKTSIKSSNKLLTHTNNLLAKAISNLEDEFKRILTTYSKPVEPDHLFDCIPNSRPPSSEPHKPDDSACKSHSDNGMETAVYSTPTLIPHKLLPLLHSLAKQVLQADHDQQILRIYRGTRASVLEQSLKKLGVERISTDDVQNMKWEVLEAKIGNWIQHVRISVKLLFVGEKNICDQIFESMYSLRDECFAEVTANSVGILLSFGEAIARNKRSPEKLFVVLDMCEIMRELQPEVKLLFVGEKNICDQIFESMYSLRDECFAEVTANSVGILLSFGEAIARNKRSPEKLFVVLDMCEIMRELQPEIGSIFGSKTCYEIRESALGLTKRLTRTAQETLAVFEEAVEKDSSKTRVLDGTVHPLTSYVINYIKFLFDYQLILKQIFQDFGNIDPEAQLATVIKKNLQALENNLDGKSKQYKDPGLAQLFMMNNIHYLVSSARSSEAKDWLGDDWVQIHRRVVQQHAKQYRRVSWAKILQCLTVQGLGSSSGSSHGNDSSNNASRTMIKHRFKNFNVQIEELVETQSQWTVPDAELRETLRLTIGEILLPAYRSFIKRFGCIIQKGSNPEKYIKYSPEDLESMLNELFEGKTWNGPKQ